MVRNLFGTASDVFKASHFVPHGKEENSLEGREDTRIEGGAKVVEEGGMKAHIIIDAFKNSISVLMRANEGLWRLGGVVSAYQVER